MRMFKRKKKYNKKPLILLLIILVLYLGIKHIKEIDIDNPKLISFLLNNTNHYINNEYSIKDIFFDNLFKLDYKYKVYEPTISKVSFVLLESPRVYIYNTHDSEKYIENTNGVYEASKIIKEKLDDLGIPTLVESSRVSEYLKINKIDYNLSYTVSRNYIESTLNTYPDIELVIDLHRDAVDRPYSYVELNNKSYAKIMFVQGIKYDTYKHNMEIAQKISDEINSNYPGVSKGIMTKQVSIFNQDLSENSILIELGTNNNTWEEVNNSIDVLVEAIRRVLNEKEIG